MNLTLRVANYISRYAPSKKKLTEYISKKKPTFPISDFLIEIDYSEDMMIDMWMRTFLARSIWEREIQMKLIKKWFSCEMIAAKIKASRGEIRDWRSYQREIETMINDFTRKWKSIQIIRMTLSWKYPYFRDEISEILEWASDDAGLIREIEKYKSKYNLSNLSEKQKFYASVQRKGFRYDDIKDALRKRDSED